MYKLFYDTPDALENTALIASRCNVKLDLGSLNLPEIHVPPGYDTQKYLEKLCLEGAKKHYKNPLPLEVSERLSYELSVIKKTGYSAIFL